MGVCVGNRTIWSIIVFLLCAGSVNAEIDGPYLYYKNDMKIQLSFVKNKSLEKLKKLHDFFETKNCRTKVILKYFVEDKNNNCNNCDNCLIFSKKSKLAQEKLTKTSIDERNTILTI